MSSIVFLGFFLFELCSSASEWYLITDPTSLKSITEDLPYSVNLTLGYNGTWDPTADDSSLLTVIVSSTNKKILLPVQDRIEFTWEDVIQGYNRTLDVIGQVVGYADLNFQLEIIVTNYESSNRTLIPLLSGYLVTVLRASNFWHMVLTVSAAVAAMFSTINMGCALDLAIIKSNLMRPVGPIVGFISQFTLMPLFSLGMALLLIEDPLQGFGLLVLGCSPGGTGSNFWTLLLGGDVNLSITMTFLSTIAALGMMPLWLFLLSDFFLPPESEIKVPYVDMSISLITLTLPLGIGLLIRHCKPKIAEFLVLKVLKPCSFVIMILMFTVVFYVLWDVLVLLDVYMLSAGLAVAGAGFVFGGLFAILARRTKAEIIAISLETAMQNGNVAFVLLRLSLPSPYSDMAGMTPIAQMMMTSAILFPLYFIHLIIKCCRSTGKMEMNKHREEDEEIVKTLMMRPTSQVTTAPTSPVSFYRESQVTDEFSWTRNPSLIVPNSPTSKVPVA